MRLFTTLSALALVSFSLVACAGAESEDPNDAVESEADLTAAAKEISGAWHVQDDDTLDAYVFNSDGTFTHDQVRVLNGMPIMGGPPPGRDMGKFTVSKAKKTITLNITRGWHADSQQKLTYKYTSAHYLNGADGHQPAKLDLTMQPAPRSHVAYQTVSYEKRTSWCFGMPNVSNADCATQRNGKTWVPTTSGNSVCNNETNACETKFSPR